MQNTYQILQLANSYEESCLQNLVKIARIKKMPGGKYRVLSLKGKNLGTYKSKEEAQKRLEQIEYFKKMDNFDADAEPEEVLKEKEEEIDLTGAIDFSFSAIMREMRQEASKEQVKIFLTLFKKCFDTAVKNKLQKPEKVALQNSLIKFNKKHKIKLKKKLIKNATVSELGDPVQVGKYLADIVRFTLNRVPADKRQNAVDSLRKKFYTFNANEIAQKNLPPTSAIGQSLTFVKHVLFNHDPHYIRDVLNNIVSNL
jgi:hypothetical protein